MSERRAAARLSVDIGGTFTDIVLEAKGRRTTAKVLTTPAAPEEGVINGVEAALSEAGLIASALSLVLHGTTLATNAIIERKGAKTAFVTTEGFRDVLEIGYESRYDQYDIMIEKPAPLVPRKLRLPVAERVDLTGQVLKPLDEGMVERSSRNSRLRKSKAWPLVICTPMPIPITNAAPAISWRPGCRICRSAFPPKSALKSASTSDLRRRAPTPMSVR